MPLYDFRSPCGTTFEKLAKPEATPPCPCGTPGCTGVRQLGAPAFAFKGTGFYDKGRPLAGKAPA